MTLARGEACCMNAAPFQQVQAFVAVARHRSFSGAARELGVSRSAVSQALRQLEEALRVVLLARTTRSVSLTEAGRRLLDGAGPAMGQVLAALKEVSAQPGEPVGRLRLSVPRSALPFVIEPVLPTFRARHPRVEVEIAFRNEGLTSSQKGTTRVCASANSSSATWCRCGSPTRFATSSSVRLLTFRAAGRPTDPRTC